MTTPAPDPSAVPGVLFSRLRSSIFDPRSSIRNSGSGIRNPAAPARGTRVTAALLLLLLLPLAAPGCRHGDRGAESAAPKGKAAESRAGGQEGSTAGIRTIHADRRDIRMTVVQPGTLQAYEVTPIYARIAGYVEKYRYNIGDRVKKGDVLVEMWIPDIVEQHSQAAAEVHRADVQIRVTESALRAAEAKVETARARLTSAEAGVKRAQASYTRWESEYKRLEQLVNQRVLDVQVRDETYRQFEEAAAARDQANAMVSEAKSALDQSIADRDRARVDVESAKAQLAVNQANEREARVLAEYGQIKAPYTGVITQRNVSPGDYLQPGGGNNGRPLFVLEQTDPLRVFVGVPELASFFVKEGDTALVRFQAIPGATREAKVVRSGFSLNPTTRTLQTEIDIANADGYLHPGWYVTVSIVVIRKQVWALPSNAILYLGQQDYAIFLRIKGKTVRVPVIVGPSDDSYTEILRKYVPGDPRNPPYANTVDWPILDGTEEILVGNLDILNQEVAGSRSGGAGDQGTAAKADRR
jgi:multidrug efflux pump subunit AcrA (membrane-fusion protein)